MESTRFTLTGFKTVDQQSTTFHLHSVGG